MKSPKVGLYLRNGKVADVDLRFPERGNPGIGGTQFGFVAMPYYVKKYHPESIQFVLYANAIGKLPSCLEGVETSSVVKAMYKADEDGCDIFFFRLTNQDYDDGVFEAIREVDMDVVLWAQNDPTLADLDRINACPSIKRIVCVGQEELDRFRDHPAFERSTRIFNGIDERTYRPSQHQVGSGTHVVYLGSLVPAKGFHWLAQVWPEIRLEVPNARLSVIGSGKLYDQQSRLGEWGIAEEEYERQQIRPYLADEQGDIHSSVRFLGSLGAEKISIMQKADVGVVNPTGKTETFCWSGVEFQASGTPVVSAAKGGLLDTVKHGSTGLLGRGREDLRHNVVRLLKDRSLREELGGNAMQFVNKFSWVNLSHEWVNLFRGVAEGLPNKPKPISQNFYCEDKIFKEILRQAKKWVPSLRAVPPLFSVNSKKEVMRRISSALVNFPSGDFEKSAHEFRDPSQEMSTNHAESSKRYASHT